MKNRKIMAILSLACAAFLLTACGHKDSTKESTSSSVKVEKTTKTSKSSSMTKSSSEDKMATAKSSTSDKMDKTQTPASSSSQTPASSQASTTQTDGSSQAGQVVSEGGEGGKGGYVETSGTLIVKSPLSVYSSPNKDSGVVYTMPSGEVAWDKYITGDNNNDGNDNWYSFVGDDGIRYYISYSDYQNSIIN